MVGIVSKIKIMRRTSVVNSGSFLPGQDSGRWEGKNAGGERSGLNCDLSKQGSLGSEQGLSLTLQYFLDELEKQTTESHFETCPQFPLQTSLPFSLENQNLSGQPSCTTPNSVGALGFTLLPQGATLKNINLGFFPSLFSENISYCQGPRVAFCFHN